MLFRFRFKVLGGHTHVRLFCGPKGSLSLGFSGELVMRNEEFDAFVSEVMRDGGSIEFVNDDAVQSEPHN